MADGSITFSTELDDKALYKGLAKIRKEIERLENSTKGQESKKSPLVIQAQELEQKMKAARAEVLKYREAWAAGVAGVDKDQAASIAKVQQLEAEHAKVVEQIDEIDAKLQPAYEKLDDMKEKAGGLERGLAAAGSKGTAMSGALETAGKRLGLFAKRLKALVRQVVVLNLITAALRGLRGWIGKVIEINGEASSAVAKLKGALLTLAQPLVAVIVPAFTALVNILTRVISVAAQLMSYIFGGSADQSKQAAKALYQEADALGKTGTAAKKAKRQLAGFDELNVLSEDAASGGGAGGSKAPDFSFDTALPEGQLKNILTLVELIGAGFLAWKLSGSLQALLSPNGITKLVGAFLSLNGAVGFVKDTFDAWQNGVDWDNLLGMLVRAAELAVGLFLLLGPKLGPIAAGISLIVTGVIMLTTAFHDMMANGMNWQNTLLAIGGLLAAGLGIGLLTGNWIPMLVAAIAGIILAFVQWTGHGEEFVEAIKLIFGGFVDFFSALVSGDFAAAGEALKQIWEGLKLAAATILAAIQDALAMAGAWLMEKAAELGAWIAGKAAELWAAIRQGWNDFWTWIGGVLAGFVTWIQETAAALGMWILEKLSGLVEGIIRKVVEFGINIKNALLSVWEGIKQGIKNFVNGGISMFENFINFIIGGINGMIQKLNTISAAFKNPFSGETVTIGFNLKQIGKVNIPRLATGAVIPPNREFMAVLGDQRSGMNIEAPESLIRKIVREESGGGAIVPELREILAAIREGKTLVVDKKVLGKTVQSTLSDAARAGGAAAIPVR